MLSFLTHPVTILVVGISIVLVGILVLRLHAFLALLLAGIAVASMTPRSALETYAQQQRQPAAKKKQTAQLFPCHPSGLSLRQVSLSVHPCHSELRRDSVKPVGRLES